MSVFSLVVPQGSNSYQTPYFGFLAVCFHNCWFFLKKSRPELFGWDFLFLIHWNLRREGFCGAKVFAREGLRDNVCDGKVYVANVCDGKDYVRMLAMGRFTLLMFVMGRFTLLMFAMGRFTLTNVCVENVLSDKNQVL